MLSCVLSSYEINYFNISTILNPPWCESDASYPPLSTNCEWLTVSATTLFGWPRPLVSLKLWMTQARELGRDTYLIWVTPTRRTWGEKKMHYNTLLTKDRHPVFISCNAIYDIVVINIHYLWICEKTKIRISRNSYNFIRGPSATLLTL